MRIRRTPVLASIRDVRRKPAHFALGVLLAAMIFAGATAAKAEKPVDVLTSCWRDTTLAGAVQSCDPPEAVVEATYHACIRQEVTWHNALLEAGGPYGADMANTMFDRVKASARNVLQKVVLRTRTEKGLCR